MSLYLLHLLVVDIHLSFKDHLIRFERDALPNGQYFYRIQMDDVAFNRFMTLIE